MPIRSELFSMERLEQHGESLAAAQRVTRRPAAGRPLVLRLEDNGRVLLEAYRTIADAISEEQVITPAAEWLVDNFHIVDEQIREIHDDLPGRYYRQLPKLADGPLEGYPRVYGIAWAFVAHTDSRFDLESLRRFVRAYQRIQPLTIGELWAVAITLRIVLVENLRRSAERIVSSRKERYDANTIADRLLGIGRSTAESPELAVGRYTGIRLPTAFSVQLVRRLRDQDPAVTPALRWLDERLRKQGTTSEKIVAEEHQFQGAMSVTVRNIITSMRLISSVDWPAFFESVSLVDAALCAHNGFAAMDFPTRDNYRHAIEDLSRQSSYTEIEITEKIIEKARKAAPLYPDSPERDPGYYLISKGRRGFEKQISYAESLRSSFDRTAVGSGMRGYLLTIAFVSVFILALPLLGIASADVTTVDLIILALLAVIPLSDVAVAIVNYLITTRIGPKSLPGLELLNGVPPSMRTMVVVPTLLTAADEIKEHIERLEVHFLANQDKNIFFALLSDWRDSATESGDGDEQLLGFAVEGIARLNKRHSTESSGELFFLLHRRRLWNEGEKKWMGWERKRGKLHELNRLLRGATDTSFVSPDSLRIPSEIRYVITLDADTRFPRNTARRLIGKMSHPLNRPKIDVHSGRVIEGYAVLQPLVTPSMPTAPAGSLFQQTFSGPGGMDPYAFVVSDVYQDLFGEGSYSGKGIYDVDIFEAALRGRIPENTVLSHDLLEGIYAGSGLVTDIEVVEEFPSRYDVAAARQHRWVRGDWQLLPWIVGHGRNSGIRPPRRSIPLIGRWKMIDNLRRSLSAPAAFLALLGGWMLPFDSAAVWTGFVLATIALPSLLPFFSGIIPRRRRISKRSHLRAMGSDLSLAASQIFFHVSVLPHQAWLMSDAILRTLYRLYFSHRHMLEWMTAAQAKFSLPLSIPGFYRRMAGGVVLSCIGGIIVAVSPSVSWMTSVPFVLLWICGPIVAQYGSRPRQFAGTTQVSDDEQAFLRLIARRTWRFFETFVSAETHMLPPDNYQETPKPALARRTSPTNVGLYLLSAVTANDFGWVGITDTAVRLEATLTTMNGLERFRGHFFNWYDTHDLRPLTPKYISTVDSGNLAGHLLTVSHACKEMMKRPLANTLWSHGIGDAVTLMRESLTAISADRRHRTAVLQQLEECLDSISTSLYCDDQTTAGIVDRMETLSQQTQPLVDLTRAFLDDRSEKNNPAQESDLIFWLTAIQESIASARRDIDLVMPWKLLRELSKDDPHIVPDHVKAMVAESVPSIENIPDLCEEAVILMTARRTAMQNDNKNGVEITAPIDVLIEAFASAGCNARSAAHRLSALKELSLSLCTAMDFSFLLDEERHVLTVGYRVSDGVLDPSCYDLLASESRLASFIAIAKGDVPVRNWFLLGRSLTPVDRGSALISWSGSMFEYLMPLLVMREPAESLLGQTNRFVVRRQLEFGRDLGIPWGVSESAYNVRDIEFTYQYSTFGVPGLGLKRGLSKDAVIAPYATGLAAMVDTREAVKNFARIADAGGSGTYGYYEALDYTPSRLPEGDDVAIVRAYMAHHQGMIMTAIGNALHDSAMVNRFHAEPIIQATELLLQERTPRDVSVARPRAEEMNVGANVRVHIPSMYGRFHSAHDSVPRTHILSNGNYAVMVTGAGSGYSQWRDLSVTRWHEDGTCDAWGSFIYLKDVLSGEVWAAGFQPTGIEPDSYEVEFSEDRIEIARSDGTIATTLEIAISPESDAEVRRVSVTNFGTRIREIEVTSYAEVVLTQPSADRAHPAFSKLFVQTEFIEEINALLATRRRRSPEEQEIWAAHLLVIEGKHAGTIQYETDRARFLGRGRDVRSPAAMSADTPLSNTVGTVLDPIFSLRCRIRILPGSTVRIAFWTMVAPSHKEVLDLADKHHDATAFERAVTLAWTQAQVQLHHLGIDIEEAHLFQHLASHILYSNPELRPPSGALLRNDSGQSGLWAHRISGDLPIVLLRIDEPDGLDIVRQLLHAHEYWQMKLLAVDLVILNEQPQSYTMDLQGALETILRTNESQLRLQEKGRTAPGTIFVLRADIISPEMRFLLQSAARAVLLSRRGSLSEQLNLRGKIDTVPMHQRVVNPLDTKNWVRKKLTEIRMENGPKQSVRNDPPLEFSNGLGGFTNDGNEYCTILRNDQLTPVPWINVIANSSFGFQVSAEGTGYTWSMNSRENKLTPWSNDPVTDRTGETIYIKDEQTGELWTPTALPIREHGGTYVARHGKGYSRFEYTSHDISIDLTHCVSLADPVKISRLKITNNSRHNRRLSVTAYIEWILAAARDDSAPFVSTEIDQMTGAMFARNVWRSEYRNRVAFVDLAGHQQSWTGDRKEFLGRHGTIRRPAALAGDTSLSNRVGAGFDPCCAMQTIVELGAGEQAEVVCFLGEAASRDDARSLINRIRSYDLDAMEKDIAAYWDTNLGVIRVTTPDRSMDILLNHWLLYQTVVCRIWARSAFYQSGGAYGFRDQLQDGMALAVSMPSLTREHLLRAAGRQFIEGDVQHWWLPVSGAGVRTKITDDALWLPYAVARYIEVTNDHEILDQIIPFLESSVLRSDEIESFSQTEISDHAGSLYEHCALALDKSISFGVHGLPLIGTGDWNDGMNTVGNKGSGESVWLGWFLYSTLTGLAPIADARGEHERSEKWLRSAAVLRESLELNAWDGEWYRRGYYDDGTPLGSSISDECRIDSIAQSWGVISGAADPERAVRAMAAVNDHLIRRNAALVVLFTPPFDLTLQEPGYIKGYPPGIRENGGQYTHAALWSAIAYAMMGDGDSSARVLSMLNPINRSLTAEAVTQYKIEPYVISADVYSEPPHVGRGGWSWYTGSSGWMYRAGLEWILGFRIRGPILHLNPCIPKEWKKFEITYRYHTSLYQIIVENPDNVSRGVLRYMVDSVDRQPSSAANQVQIPLVNDCVSH